MLKYYCNQTFFFALKQSPYLDKELVILAITNQLIAKFAKLNGSLMPVWFDKAEEELGNELDIAIKKITKELHINVAWAFNRFSIVIIDTK